jgi:hypothetical protein
MMIVNGNFRFGKSESGIKEEKHGLPDWEARACP